MGKIRVAGVKNPPALALDCYLVREVSLELVAETVGRMDLEKPHYD